MVFDAHAHIFPDTIAQRASGSIADFYSMPVRFDGKLSTLLALGEQAGIGRFLVHSVALAPNRARHISEFIAGCVAAHPDALLGFAALHPDTANLPAEIDFAISAGLRGVKLHPDMQCFALDEPRALRMFEALEGRLPVLVHTGDSRYPYSNPRKMLEALRRFPKLTAICAHLGGWSEWDEAAELLPGFPNLYVDTSSSLYTLPPTRAVQIIRAFGAERVLFGSDFPMWDPGAEKARLEALPLTDSEKHLILSENARRLFA